MPLGQIAEYPGFVAPFSDENPILGQSRDLEVSLEGILGKVPNHDFQLVRYLHWPMYRMPVYFYSVGTYDVILERHTSYWMFQIRSAQAFKIAPFVELLSDKRQVFFERARKTRRSGAGLVKVTDLAVHVHDDSEVEHFVSKSIPFML